MKIYLVRHAESFSREGKNYIDGYNVGLSSAGRIQARVCGYLLRRENIVRIVSSPMARTQETAEIIGSIINLPVSFDKRLEEYAPSRTLYGKDFKEAKRRARTDWNFVPQDGESVSNSTKRFLSALEDLTRNQKEEGVIIVISHALIIQNVLMVLLQQKNPLEIDEASITIFTYDGKQFHVDTINKCLPYFWRLWGKFRKQFKKHNQIWN